MDFLKIIHDADIERFKASSIIERAKGELEAICRGIVFKKYEGTKISHNGICYELLLVKAVLFTYMTVSREVEITLIFTATGKLSKNRLDAIERATEYYEKHGILPPNNHKIPLWRSLRYEIDIQKLMSGNINLELTFK